MAKERGTGAASNSNESNGKAAGNFMGDAFVMDDLETSTGEKGFLKYTLQVNASPYQGEAADLAFGFASALVAKGHVLHRVFFYRDGVYHALWRASLPPEEGSRLMRWSKLANERGVDLVVCSAAAHRRGVWDPEEGSELAQGFRVAGLALLVESILETDRYLVFG